MAKTVLVLIVTCDVQYRAFYSNLKLVFFLKRVKKKLLMKEKEYN